MPIKQFIKMMIFCITSGITLCCLNAPGDQRELKPPPPIPHYPMSCQQRTELLRDMLKLADSKRERDFLKLIDYAKDPDPNIRVIAAMAASKSRDIRAIDLISPLTADKIRQVRLAAVLSLGYLDNEKAYGILSRVLEQDDVAAVRGSAIMSLARLGTEESIRLVINLLTDNSPVIRKTAAKELGKIRDKKVIEPLIEAIKDPDAEVSQAALSSLNDLIGGPAVFNETSKMDKNDAYQTWKNWWDAKENDLEKLQGQHYLNNQPHSKKYVTLVDEINYWEQKSKNATNAKDRALAYCQIALRYSDRGEPDKMMEYFGRALSIAPEDPKVLHQAAKGYFHAEKYDLSISAMKKAKELVADSNDEKLKKLIYGDYETLKRQCALIKKFCNDPH